MWFIFLHKICSRFYRFQVIFSAYITFLYLCHSALQETFFPFWSVCLHQSRFKCKLYAANQSRLAVNQIFLIRYFCLHFAAMYHYRYNMYKKISISQFQNSVLSSLFKHIFTRKNDSNVCNLYYISNFLCKCSILHCWSV